ncbi:hypothetical protein KC573_02590, partial [candidate division WWE3 bacterium]|nr:hypothetical protein [candidate division WWE3 bacterium]
AAFIGIEDEDGSVSAEQTKESASLGEMTSDKIVSEILAGKVRTETARVNMGDRMVTEYYAVGADGERRELSQQEALEVGILQAESQTSNSRQEVLNEITAEDGEGIPRGTVVESYNAAKSLSDEVSNGVIAKLRSGKARISQAHGGYRIVETVINSEGQENEKISSVYSAEEIRTYGLDEAAQFHIDHPGRESFDAELYKEKNKSELLSQQDEAKVLVLTSFIGSVASGELSIVRNPDGTYALNGEDAPEENYSFAQMEAAGLLGAYDTYRRNEVYGEESIVSTEERMDALREEIADNLIDDIRSRKVTVVQTHPSNCFVIHTPNLLDIKYTTSELRQFGIYAYAVETPVKTADAVVTTETTKARMEAVSSEKVSGTPESRAQEIISSTESINNFENLTLQEQLVLMNQCKELVQLLLGQAESSENKVQQMLLQAVMIQVEQQIEQIEQQIKEQNDLSAETDQFAEVEAQVESPSQKYSEQLKNLADMPFEQQIGFLSEVMGDFFETSKITESSAAKKARSELFTIMMEIFRSLFNIESQAQKTTEPSPESTSATPEDSPEASVGADDTTSDPIQPVSAGVYVDTGTDEPVLQNEVVDTDTDKETNVENEQSTLSPELEAFHTAVTGGESSSESYSQNEAESIVNSVFDNETSEDPLEAYQQASTYDVETSS